MTGVFAYAALLLIISFIGEGNRPGQSVLEYISVNSTISLAIVGLLIIALKHSAVPEQRNRLWISRLSVLAAIISMGLYFRGPKSISLLIVLFAISELSRRRKMTVVWAIAIPFFFLVYASIQINRFAAHSQSDMMLLIEGACQSLLIGENPYRQYSMNVAGAQYSLPLTYFPLQWIFYLPAVLLNIDLRWVNVVSQLTFYLLTVWWIYQNLRSESDRHFAITMIVSVLLNGYFMRRLDSELFILGPILILFFLVQRSEKSIATAMTMGLHLATSPLMLIPYSVFCLMSYQKRDRTWFWPLPYVLLSLPIALIFFLPFLFLDPVSLRAGIIDHWTVLDQYAGEWAWRSIRNLNFSVLFYHWQFQSALKYVQIFLWAALLFLSANFTRRIWFVSALILYVFLLFNIVVWTYLFFPVIIMLLCGILLEVREWSQSDLPVSVKEGQVVIQTD